MECNPNASLNLFTVAQRGPLQLYGGRAKPREYSPVLNMRLIHSITQTIYCYSGFQALRPVEEQHLALRASSRPAPPA